MKVTMDSLTRDHLEALAGFPYDRIGRHHENGDQTCQVEPLRRMVRHAVTGHEACLAAGESRQGTLDHQQDTATELGESLERFASCRRGQPAPTPGTTHRSTE
ncbi:hypothetical protein ACFU7Y_02645 [Kitasatospora sp. NPDC057542]|uniref:hypothetical protein n=1 Tax=Kitasatospora sp. NPDC057542 TaxID=3346162 RepID=UPI0036CE9E1E